MNNYSLAQMQIDEYIDELKDFSRQSYDELVESLSFKQLILNHFQYFMHDEGLKGFFSERDSYYENLCDISNDSDIMQDIQRLKSITVELHKQLSLSNGTCQYYIPNETLEEEFTTLFKLVKKPESINTDTLNSWFWWLRQFTKSFRVHLFFNDEDCEFGNLYKEFALLYGQLYEKMVKIPIQLYVDDFITFGKLYSTTANGSIDNLKLLSEDSKLIVMNEYKTLIRTAIRVFKEFKKELEKRKLDKSKHIENEPYNDLYQVKNNNILTPKEKEIVLAVLEGLSYDGIAKKLSISTKTVESHLSNIYKKTGCSNMRNLSLQFRG